ncbi:MAG: GTPase [Dokdonia sp.]|jgi:hypothetical protein
MKLIFVYNANSGAFQQLLDTAHKVVSPQTYTCDLCSLTHGSFRESALWKTYRQTSGHSFTFFHKDEFEKAYRSKWLPKYRFPIVLIEDPTRGLEIGLNAEDLAKIETTQELIDKVAALSKHF